MHTHVRGIQPVILRRTCPIHRECAGYICAALCFFRNDAACPLRQP